MATASDWWARRLSGQTPAPQAPPLGTPAAPRYVAPPPPPTFTPATYDAQTGLPAADDGVMAIIANAALQTGGSKRVKEDSGICPECGSGNFFARRYTEHGMPLRMEAAPRCYDCGYPIIQAGSQHGGASSARNEGPTKAARQLPKNHAVTVIDGGGTYTFPSE